jgi:hypothetical protein
MKTLSILLTVLLAHAQLVLAAGCDLPNFGGARLFRAVSGSSYLSVADFNQDDTPDVVLGGGNGDGTFRSAINYGGGAPSRLAVGDVNGDGRPDLAINGASGVVVLLNTCVPGSGASSCSPLTP